MLLRLAEREENVQAKIYTQRTSPSFNVALARHNDQYAPIDLSIFTQSHDRFLLIDQDVLHQGLGEEVVRLLQDGAAGRRNHGETFADIIIRQMA